MKLASNCITYENSGKMAGGDSAVSFRCRNLAGGFLGGIFFFSVAFVLFDFSPCLFSRATRRREENKLKKEVDIPTKSRDGLGWQSCFGHIDCMVLGGKRKTAGELYLKEKISGRSYKD